MKIILFGPPGAGKGTQAHKICQKLKIKLISVGEILRAAIEAGSELGIKAKAEMGKGNLISDEIVCQLVLDEINSAESSKGFLLDGFPRNIAQTDYLLSNNVSIDFLIRIDVPDAMIIRRLSGRRVHIKSGRGYHIEYNKPKKENIDDITGEELVIRNDDKEEVILNRLRVYAEQTEPVLEKFYNINFNIIKIDGLQDIETVFTEIMQKIS